ncbi:unnamed protein product [Darwinula stevensoni]|uniref:DDHD domain-containing protein n=1 Tax=Darwinula stevensoni TaxID=69355 RepID=A0A7R8XCH1_9CRUS|nr:unnamed protein product [Darwinula stevensoni]CAG0888834.1 unnamed protein product [Darwinula stevensoni]
MLVKEYRIPLPLTVDEYRIAQLYMIAKKSRLASTGVGSGVEILVNEPYTDGPGGSGQYTHKLYHIGSHLPGWLKSLLPRSALTVEEEAWNAYPYTKTRYKCPFVERFVMELETRYFNDNGFQDNVFGLSSKELQEREVDFIDIVKDQLASSDYIQEEDPRYYISKTTGRGPLSENWIEEYWNACRGKKTPLADGKAIMCAYKLCRVEFRYWGMQSKIERFIHDIALRKTMVPAHKQAWSWQDEWYGKTIEEIRLFEQETQEILASKMAGANEGDSPQSPDKEFPPPIPEAKETLSLEEFSETRSLTKWSSMELIPEDEEDSPRIQDANQELSTKTSDVVTFRGAFESVVRQYYPSLLGRVAHRLVPCPPICAEALAVFTSLSPYSFDAYPSQGDGGFPVTHDSVPIGAIPLFAITSPDYWDSVSKTITLANQVYQDFLKSEEGYGQPTGTTGLRSDRLFPVWISASRSSGLSEDARPAVQQVYNMFHAINPLAGRLEPLLSTRFAFIPPVSVPRYQKHPLGDGFSYHLCERKTAKVWYNILLVCEWIVTGKWWGLKRLDYALYCPEGLANFPPHSLPHLLHASYWESQDVIAFIIRQNMSANHRANDVIVGEGMPQVISARFMYGPLDMVALSGEKVDLYCMTDPKTGEWVLLDTLTTDKTGRVTYTISPLKALTFGIYPVKMVVRGDHTGMDFHLAVIPPKTECVVFSIDGSFTASVSVTGRDPKVRPGAVDVVRHWQEMGYLIVYVTARPDMQQRFVISWLAQHNFPHGMVSFADGLSTDFLAHKVHYLKHLIQEVGVVIHCAYGSSKDIGVYASLGLEPSQIYIVGKTSRKHYSSAIVLMEGYAAHLSELTAPGGSRPARGNARMVIPRGFFSLPGQGVTLQRRLSSKKASMSSGRGSSRGKKLTPF